ncbi:M24 family metallopeptidase, partial [Candidatus Latescibacterota bacterium]
MRTDVHELMIEKVRETGLDTLFVGNQTNVRYVTGFTCDSGFAAVNSRDPSFFINPLYSEHAQSIVKKPFTIHEVKDGIFKYLSRLDISFWGTKVGYEADTLTCTDFTKLKEALKDVELIATTGLIEELRMIKRSSEIKSITGAQRISEEVFNEVLSLVREGVEERDLALEIDYRIRKKGGERAAFEIIAASGPNTSKPHAVPSGRKLKAGDIVLFDMGTIIDGYASDMTRTVVLGKADPKLKKIYSTVLK